jgi:hypothetical protein
MSKIGAPPSEYQNRFFGFEDLTKELPMMGMLLKEELCTTSENGRQGGTACSATLLRRPTNQGALDRTPDMSKL